MKWSKTKAIAYLSAMIDAEGSVTISGNKYCRITVVTNTEYAIIQACKDALAVVGVDNYCETTQQRDGLKPCHMVQISRNKDVCKLGRLLDLQHPNKRVNLKFALTTKVRASKKPDERPIDEVLSLYRHGVIPREIGEVFGVTGETVRAWLRQTGEPVLKNRSYLAGNWSE